MSNHNFQSLTFLSPGSEDVDPELSPLASLGFTGCLSVVRFNSVSPLKAALLHPHSSPVVITGPLLQSTCGSSASANPHAAEDTHHLSGRRGGVTGWSLFCSRNVLVETLNWVRIDSLSSVYLYDKTYYYL